MQRKQVFNTALCIVLILSVALTAVLLFTDVIRSDENAEAATVKQGSTGATVRQIQQKLKTWGYYTGSVDGIFGSQTRTAVRYFQQKNGLTVDGIVGKQTAGVVPPGF